MHLHLTHEHSVRVRMRIPHVLLWGLSTSVPQLQLLSRTMLLPYRAETGPVFVPGLSHVDIRIAQVRWRGLESCTRGLLGSLRMATARFCFF